MELLWLEAVGVGYCSSLHPPAMCICELSKTGCQIFYINVGVFFYLDFDKWSGTICYFMLLNLSLLFGYSFYDNSIERLWFRKSTGKRVTSWTLDKVCHLSQPQFHHLWVSYLRIVVNGNEIMFKDILERHDKHRLSEGCGMVVVIMMSLECRPASYGCLKGWDVFKPK